MAELAASRRSYPEQGGFEMKDQDFSARNLSMLIDFYELTMANGYFQSDKRDTVAVFDMFFRV